MLFIILQVLLFLIAYQDFKRQSVMAVLLFGIIAVSFAYSLQLQPTKLLVLNSLVNLAITTLIVGLLTAYYSIKSKRRINIFKKHFGFGDFLFFLCLCVMFSSEQYLTFIICSSIIILLLYLVLEKFNILSKNKIPLAGFQAAFLSLLLYLEKFTTIPARF